MHLRIHAWPRVLAPALVAVAVGCTLAVSPAAASPKRPPCTRKAIAAGLRRGKYKTPGAIIEGFKCAGRFALSVDVWEGVTVPALLRAQGTHWVTVNREIPCKRHVIPKKIYFDTCIAS